MDNRRPAPGRTPSPGHALQHGYHQDDQAYGQPQLDIPMGPTPGRYGTPADNLHIQPAHSIENLGTGSPFDDGRYGQDSYSVDPQSHQDAYYNQQYDDGYGGGGDVGYGAGGAAIDDQRPMLPHQESAPYTDNPQPTPSPAPIKRWKTVKRVELYRGNLVLDCPVPPKLLNQLPHGERDEFTHMRYSAATCDPNDFASSDFTLRQKLFSKPRQTELFIVVTMYNEDDILFARTMIGVLKNVEYMCNRPSSKTWGKDAWKKIVVCVVSDGRNKIDPRTRALLAGMGVYQEGIAKDNVNGKGVQAHIYEYTTQIGMRIKDNAVQLIPKSQPVQILFCLKEKNAKKINSHRWFFNAFGPVLDPNICVLIDAGTKPGSTSIYHLWKAFDLEPMCGGACGEIKAMLGTAGRNLINPLVATQNFEYKMSNILDKPLESAFGFISVLPGAFSAYRYVALQNDKTGQGPLEKYFKGETLHGGVGAGVFESNMYLAEDRILCFELVTKRKCSWILQYVKSATGETDVPDGISELVLQRRRWLNGSFFAAIYAIAHFYQFFRSDHSFIRKFMFLVEFVYNTINMIFAWFAIGNFFLVFKILVDSLSGDNLLGTVGSYLSVVFQWLYGVCLMTCFVISMGNRPAGWLSRRIYATMAWFWAIIMCYLMFAAIFIAVIAIKTDIEDDTGFSVTELFTNKLFYTLIISLMSTYGLWLLASLIMFDPWHMVTSLIQYILLTPTFLNILNVYAFCNTHDVSWGTKGDDKAEKLGGASTKDGAVKVDLPDESDLNAQYERELAVFRVKAPKEVSNISPEQKQEDYYSGVRSIIVLLWMLMNFGLIAAVLSTAGVDKLGNTDDEVDEDVERQARAEIYLAVVLWSVAGLSAFKFIGAMWFLIVRLFRGV